MWSFLWCSRRSHDIDPPSAVQPKNVKEEVSGVVEDLIKSVELAAASPSVEVPVELAAQAEPVELTGAPPEPLVLDTPKKSKKLPAHMYTHKVWPSPRAVNLVRTILKNKYKYPKYRLFADSCKIDGRLSHEKALNALASFAGITFDELLTIEAGVYHDTYLYKRPMYNDAKYMKYMRDMIIC